MTATSGGSNLFGKHGPNLDLSVGLVFVLRLGLHVGLNFGLSSGPSWACNVDLSGGFWCRLVCVGLRFEYWLEVLV